MSQVTNLIAAWGTCSREDDELLLQDINDEYDHGQLVSVEDTKLPLHWYGGTKCLEVNLAIGAFNNLRLQEWIDNIRTHVDFKSYGCDFLQFILQPQEYEGFGIIDVYKGEGFEPFNYDL